jgi:urease subunit gamma/beta
VFDRATAFGMRLNIASGTAVRFEPGDDRSVSLVRLGGRRIVHGLNALTEGATDPANKPAALRRARERGFEASKT